MQNLRTHLRPLKIARPLRSGLHCIFRFRVFALRMLPPSPFCGWQGSSRSKRSTGHRGLGAEDRSGEAFSERLWFPNAAGAACPCLSPMAFLGQGLCTRQPGHRHVSRCFCSSSAKKWSLSDFYVQSLEVIICPHSSLFCPAFSCIT